MDPLKQLTKALVERALQADITEHLGHDKNETVINPAGNANIICFTDRTLSQKLKSMT